jgi:hypothetical protein
MVTRGQRFMLGGQQWKVVYVGVGRAHCVSTSTRLVTVKDKHGNQRTFTATSKNYIDISPDSPLELLKETL